MILGEKWIGVIVAACGQYGVKTTNRYVRVDDIDDLVDAVADFLDELRGEGWCGDPWVLAMELYVDNRIGRLELCDRYSDDADTIEEDLGEDICSEYL